MTFQKTNSKDFYQHTEFECSKLPDIDIGPKLKSPLYTRAPKLLDIWQQKPKSPPPPLPIKMKFPNLNFHEQYGGYYRE
jgi:hypothetical protein